MARHRACHDTCTSAGWSRCWPSCWSAAEPRWPSCRPAGDAAPPPPARPAAVRRRADRGDRLVVRAGADRRRPGPGRRAELRPAGRGGGRRAGRGGRGGRRGTPTSGSRTTPPGPAPRAWPSSPRPRPPVPGRCWPPARSTWSPTPDTAATGDGRGRRLARPWTACWPARPGQPPVTLALRDPAGSGDGMLAAGAVGEAVWIADGMDASAESLAKAMPVTRTVTGAEPALPRSPGEVGVLAEHALLPVLRAGGPAAGYRVLAPTDHTALLRYSWFPTAAAVADPATAGAAGPAARHAHRRRRHPGPGRGRAAPAGRHRSAGGPGAAAAGRHGAAVRGAAAAPRGPRLHHLVRRRPAGRRPGRGGRVRIHERPRARLGPAADRRGQGRLRRHGPGAARRLPARPLGVRGQAVAHVGPPGAAAQRRADPGPPGRGGRRGRPAARPHRRHRPARHHPGRLPGRPGPVPAKGCPTTSWCSPTGATSPTPVR